MTERRRSIALRAATAPLREACRNHPFVLGIADGSLPPSVFARWVIQDWRYLLTYVAVLEQLAAMAPRPEATQRWQQLATFTRTEELKLHRAYALRFGITEHALDTAIEAPATTAYTAYLRDGVRRSYGLGVAALVPCGVGYVTLASDLAQGPLPKDDRYADWIVAYSDPAFAAAVRWMEAELDAAVGSEDDFFATYQDGAKHELAFWDQLWSG